MGRLGEAMQPGVYGGGAGYKEPTTSRDAARVVTSTLAARQASVLEVIREAGDAGLTPEEAAKRMNVDVRVVAPRFTELGPKHLNMIEPTGERRPNDSGLLAKAYREKIHDGE